ncbi:hypothetical protein [Acidianus manzaensis]|uniref:Uncharacterized protein n=1 Tax=Acidianus manzaensis TaxID=282676 RepID=A0A1W6K121_9CREN|nr:hypothetical protein [Acidianus manzaensis]ARM76209.1 hypothetical protein B6F84_09355 [Acidianus manzaensis]
MALELENVNRKFLDKLGFKIGTKPIEGYEITYRYIPINSVKEVVLFKIENGKEIEIASFSNNDNALDVAKLLDGYPERVVEEVLQTLK